MDQETIRLADKLAEISGSGDKEDDFWKELEDEAEETYFLDKMVFVLSDGDILKARAIWNTITLNEGLEWLITMLINRT